MVINNIWLIYRSESEVAKKASNFCLNQLKKLGVNYIESVAGKNQEELIKLIEQKNN